MHCSKYKYGDLKGALLNHLIRHGKVKSVVKDSKDNMYFLNNKLIVDDVGSPERQPTLKEFVKMRQHDIEPPRRKDYVAMFSWAITLPNEVLPQDLRRATDLVVDFMRHRYGEENFYGAFAHLDEAGRPHIHSVHAPVLNDKFNARELLCAREFSKIHRDIQKYLSKELGYPVYFLNGQTMKKGKTVAELKLESENAELQSQLRFSEEQRKKQAKRIEKLEAEVNALKGVNPKTKKQGKVLVDLSPVPSSARSNGRGGR